LRIAVFGRTGQVALELARLGADCLGRDEADFTDPDAVRRAAARVEADAIVNAAAYTAVDRAESEVEIARTVNAVSVGALAEVAAARGLPFVHISTDYVFDGSGTAPRRPGDPTGPLGAYGRTKLEGERAVAAAGGAHAVLRTSWVFSAHGANFVKTMLRLGAERDRLRIVGDQIGGPTPARGIAGPACGSPGRWRATRRCPAPITTPARPT
jgi:dTDP-4-dehydrorhamnose reductase